MPAATKLCTCISHGCHAITFVDDFGVARRGVSVTRNEYAEHKKDDQVKRLFKSRLPEHAESENAPICESHEPEKNSSKEPRGDE